MTDKKELKDNELEKELKEDELEKVDGGYVFFDRYGSGKWQVIDDIHGGIRDYEYLSKQAAQEAAAEKGLSTDEISWDDLDKLRKEFDKKNAEWERQFRESQNKK
jgi:hypothetical protein